MTQGRLRTWLVELTGNRAARCGPREVHAVFVLCLRCVCGSDCALFTLCSRSDCALFTLCSRSDCALFTLCLCYVHALFALCSRAPFALVTLLATVLVVLLCSHYICWLNTVIAYCLSSLAHPPYQDDGRHACVVGAVHARQ